MLKKIMIAAPFVWAAFVLILHVMPVHLRDDSSFRFPHSDKIVHFCMFLGLAALTIRAFQSQSQTFQIPFKSIVSAIVISAVYGVMMELLQKYSPAHRDADILDWCADVIGASIGALLALKIRGRWISRLAK